MKKTGFTAILIPGATVFFSSFCIMVIELVASRLIARHLGSSLYTWTAVIGIVLAGITIGNYIGGRIADRFKPKKALSIIFLLCSASCVLTVMLNNLIGNWTFLWYLSWPARVFSHVGLVFILPSLLLGTISPVVAKMALDKSLPQGRTVGDIYACGAAGSIAGTFAAGYYLIAAMGTIAIIWTVGAALLVMSILYWVNSLYSRVYAVIFILCLLTAFLPYEGIQNAAASVGLRDFSDPDIVYESETQYCHVTIRQDAKNTNQRYFVQDKLKHSEVLMDNFLDLQDFYINIFAAIAREAPWSKKDLSFLHIGGGGYVFPRYVEKFWPGCRNDVVEIDPGVTEAAMAQFGLRRDTTINTIQMDARNYVDRLIENERLGKAIIKYDFIVEDAFSDYSVPFQLVTKEFNDKISQIMSDEGIYVINAIDIYDSGLFMGSYVHTLEQTFPYVTVGTVKGSLYNQETFIIAASKRPINLGEIVTKYRSDILFWDLSGQEIETLRQKAGYVVLTDDYVPVENMLAPVVRQSARELLISQLQNKALFVERHGEPERAIELYQKIIRMEPKLSFDIYNRIGLVMISLNRPADALNAMQAALNYNETLEVKKDPASLYFRMGLILSGIGNKQQAGEYLYKAAKCFQEDLVKYPDSEVILFNLGNIYLKLGNYTEAAKYLKKAVDIAPHNVENQICLAHALFSSGRPDESIDGLKKAADDQAQQGNTTAEMQLRKLINTLEQQTIKR